MSLLLPPCRHDLFRAIRARGTWVIGRVARRRSTTGVSASRVAFIRFRTRLLWCACRWRSAATACRTASSLSRTRFHSGSGAKPIRHLGYPPTRLFFEGSLIRERSSAGAMVATSVTISLHQTTVMQSPVKSSSMYLPILSEPNEGTRVDCPPGVTLWLPGRLRRDCHKMPAYSDICPKSKDTLERETGLEPATTSLEVEDRG